MKNRDRQSEQDDLQRVRQAAFELAPVDPSAAVRELRRLVRRGGDIEALARGALGEILLEEFGDLEGALHEFDRLLAMAPGLPAAEIGRARALGRSGRVAEAKEAFARAIAGLEGPLREAAAGTHEVATGAEEAVLTVLELAVEERELAPGKPAATHPDVAILDWAERMRLFDSDEQTPDRLDWERYVTGRALVEALDGRSEEALQTVERAGAAGHLPGDARAWARSLVREAAGDSAAAASEALAAVREQPEQVQRTLRAADLLAGEGRVAEARQLLLGSAAAIENAAAEAGAAEEGELLQLQLAEIRGRIEALPRPSLVSLGVQPRERT